MNLPSTVTPGDSSCNVTLYNLREERCLKLFNLNTKVKTALYGNTDSPKASLVWSNYYGSSYNECCKLEKLRTGPAFFFFSLFFLLAINNKSLFSITVRQYLSLCVPIR